MASRKINLPQPQPDAAALNENAQPTPQTLRANFQKQGVTWKVLSFFGRLVQRCTAVGAVSPKSLLAKFRRQQVTRSKPSFFGRPVRDTLPRPPL